METGGKDSLVAQPSYQGVACYENDLWQARVTCYHEDGAVQSRFQDHGQGRPAIPRVAGDSPESGGRPILFDRASRL